MPDFAIDRLKIAKGIGLKWITIHSMEPLPVEQHQIMMRIDPVLVGWKEKPWIHSNTNDYWDVGMGLDNIAGFVIAMWDMDKELTL